MSRRLPHAARADQAPRAPARSPWLGRALGLLLVLHTAAPGLAAPVAPLLPPQQPEPDGLIASPEPGWPQWRGPRRDGVSGETGLLPAWPEGGPRLRWQIDNLGRGWSSPIIVGQRLYVTGDVDDDLLIYAFDLQGRPLWRTKNGRAWTGSFPGARACCAYSQGRLYHLNAHGRLACLDAQGGQELWTCDLRDRFGVSEITWGLSECLLVDGPRLLVTPGGEQTLMAALEKTSGQTVWSTGPLEGDGATHAAPLLLRFAGRRIVANCSSLHGFGVDADSGKLLWTVPLKNTYSTNVAMPVYGAGRIFYVTAYAGGACYRLLPEAGGVRAEKAWDTPLDTCTAAVILCGGRLYGSGYRKHKSWLCTDWESGRLEYEFTDLASSGAVWADGRLFCLSEDGRVALVRPTAERMQIEGQFRPMSERCRDAWAHPVLLDGRLYVRYHGTLWCYDVRDR